MNRTPVHSMRLVVALLGAISAGTAVAATHASLFADAGKLHLRCKADNDLYKVLLENKVPCVRCDTPEQAVGEAPEGAGVLVLADDYPAKTTPLAPAIFEEVRKKNLRLYVEYPATLPGATVGQVKTRKFGPWGVLWERGVVASDFFGNELPPSSIVMIHDCHYVPVAVEKPHLVLARVAGYDRAALGLPKETQPILFQLPGRDVLVSATRLSQFVTGRYAPTDAWRGVWRGILRWLQPGAVPPQLSWTPTVRATYDRTVRLPPEAQKEAVRRGAEWFLRSGLLVDPKWTYRKHREDELKPALWPDWRHGDGSRGILEGYMTRILRDGRQGVSLDVRNDCNAESAMAMALGAKITGNAAMRETAGRLIRYNAFDSPMVKGPRADAKDPNYGMIGWSAANPTTYFGDDNARALLGTIAVAATTRSSDPTPFILRGVLANFRITGPQGFRPSVLDEGALSVRGWRHYWDTNTVQLSPHYEAWIWTAYLWLYRQTGFAPLKDRTREGIRRMMAAYPNGWFVECGRREADLARMLLPLAWLVRVDDTPEHRAWLRRIADDLLALQDASGAIPQRVTAPITANEQYGTGEAPIIYANGDPATDLLYTSNFAAIGLHEAAAATGDGRLRQAADRTAEFLIRCQVRSETHPELDGAWFRSFDCKRWEYYGSDGDLGWGVWSAETGWTQGWIVATLALRELKTSLWDVSKDCRTAMHFDDIRRQMLPDEAVSPPAAPQAAKSVESWAIGPFVKLEKPVLSPTPESTFHCPIKKVVVKWEELAVYNPAAVVKDGKVWLLYRGNDKMWKWKPEPDKPVTEYWTDRIGLAYSSDGRTFTRCPEPVLHPDNDFLKEFEWEGGLWDPRVIEDEQGTYYMYYNTNNGKTHRLCVATSKDLRQWKKLGSVFSKTDPNGANISGSVVWRLKGDGRRVAAKISGKYWMYYDHTARLATSDNLIDWTPVGKQLWGYRRGHFDSASGEPGTAMLTDRGILFIYNGQNHSGGPGQGADPRIVAGAWTLGQSLLDGRDPARLLQRADRPFLAPEYGWEKAGVAPQDATPYDAIVMHDGLVYFKGEWLLYYGGGDDHVGLAVYKPKAGSALLVPK